MSFGRMAKFDYLTMIGKLELAHIEPGSTYLEGATGPLAGARLLFGGSTTARLSREDLHSRSVELGDALGVGMQNALDERLSQFDSLLERKTQIFLYQNSENNAQNAASRL